MIKHLLHLNIHNEMSFGGSNDPVCTVLREVLLEYKITRTDTIEVCPEDSKMGHICIATVEATLIRSIADGNSDIYVIANIRDKDPQKLKEMLINQGWQE